MNAFNKHRAAAVMATAAALAGCAPTTPHWESSFGTSVRASMAAQVIDPASARNTDPVNGIDGRAAQGIVGQYASGFARPAKESASMTSGKSQ